MGCDVQVVWAGRHRRDRWDELCEGYRRRLRPFLTLEERVVRVKSPGAMPGRLVAEARTLLATLPRPGRWVGLDRRGEAVSSEELASRLGTWLDEGPRPVVFILGSDLGLDGSLLGECHATLSLGPLTLPHELARLVLYEQLYRCVAIRAGIKYHR